MKTNSSRYGYKTWAFAAGHIPLRSTGVEPEFTSHDKIAILNPCELDADIELQIFYKNADPVGNYKIKVEAKRLKKIRFNDLIDPLPISLDTPFGFILKSSIEVIVQFSRFDTSSQNVAIFCTTPYFQNFVEHE
jgi:hypothetical protein